ncbi:hypothetical protein KAFR_0G02840 [Kazachstania africana CBS 2517]|uniref:Small ribosomal subunit protein uS5m n=1 Tax=Kazachstania africana (strain ATCC 22294 / BCRC 22015 / CBS 2517 / CECT 1963 / NBRC 1671 / NRRL Y-8276) TaxID=1071382 RepID=H2AY66_KAZAF|nr:hypothetical protein KAFR_0G02840 [Kazachstania africana CBS 2517]CCF59316.1 hypothetical protein KAFR_0G02840 [Kazachstania africana CBS 2517]
MNRLGLTRLSRSFSRFSQSLDHYNDEVLLKYYPKHLLKSIKLAQQAIPENIEFTNKSTYQFASSKVFSDDLSKLDPFWDYDSSLPHNHSSTNSSPYYTPFNINQPKLPEATYPDEVKAFASKDKISKNLILANAINKQTLIDPFYIMKKLTMKPIVLKRVSNQTAKGKITSFYSLVIVGDGNGMIGIGEGKSRSDVSKATFKAHWDAIRNIQYIPRFEKRTIFNDIDYRYHGVKIFLRKKEPGFGLRVNHVIYEICQILGIKDLSGKIYKSRNDMNIAKGVIEALTKGQRPLDEIALGRGKKIVDIKKVYYSE